MKCKVGDMAVVVRSAANNEGRVVTCMKFLGKPGIFKWNDIYINLEGGDWWQLDRNLNMLMEGVVHNNHSPFAKDSSLMPIGDAPKEEVEHDGMASSMSHELV